MVTCLRLPLISSRARAATSRWRGRCRFEPGTVLAIDRGYMDYDWFVELTRQGVYFVSRLKRNAVVEVIEDRPVPKNRNILKDQVVFFPHHAQAREEYFFRLVEVWVPEKEQSIIFLTATSISVQPRLPPSIRIVGRWSCFLRR